MGARHNTPTFLDHILELRRRVFWVMAAVLVASGIGYVLRDSITAVLLAPLHGQALIYTAPAGGLEFVLKISIFFGILAALPVFVYHTLRYIEPVLFRQSRRYLAGIIIASIALMVAGSSFAYYITLPAALKFLTGFGTAQIQAFLSTNEYISFVLIYLIGFALLFQIPLLLLFINRMTPLKPSSLMKKQRYIIIFSFIAAAVITPTPDPLNQLFMAAPMIIMYQVGVVAVWLVNRGYKPAIKAQPKRILLPLINLAEGQKLASRSTQVTNSLRSVHSATLHQTTQPIRSSTLNLALKEPARIYAKSAALQPRVPSYRPTLDLRNSQIMMAEDPTSPHIIDLRQQLSAG